MTTKLACWGMNAKNTKSEAHATCSDDGLTLPEGFQPHVATQLTYPMSTGP